MAAPFGLHTADLYLILPDGSKIIGSSMLSIRTICLDSMMPPCNDVIISQMVCTCGINLNCVFFVF